jgi:hypothetical protein
VSYKQSEESGAFADSWTEAIAVGAQGKRTSVSCKSGHGPGRPEPWWSSDEELMIWPDKPPQLLVGLAEASALSNLPPKGDSNVLGVSNDLLERSVSSLCGGCDSLVDMEGCGKEKDLRQCVCLWTLSVL